MGAGSLLVDLYELTMVAAAVPAGMADRPATFSLFVRDLPPDRGYLVAAGLDDVLTWLEDLSFGPDEIGALERLGVFDEAFLAWLEDATFTGSVRAVPEGTPVFAGEPVLEVDGPYGVAQLAETYALNQVTLQTMLATKAKRCVDAAAGRPVVDFALRRTQGVDAGMKLARAGRIAGLAGTSNVAGADRYGLTATGTMAHSFVQAFGPDGEIDAFRAFARRWGSSTVLLVDTYDTLRGLEAALVVAGEMRERRDRLRGVRLDSGDLDALSRAVRARLDEAGHGDVEIVASGGLDEFAVAELVAAGAPIDGFGVGTAMGTSRDAPSLDSVYKLVEFDGRPVRKTSEGKETWPGRKQVWRQPGGPDRLGLHGERDEGGEPVLVEVMREGRRTPAATHATDLAAAAGRCEEGVAALAGGVRRLRAPDRYPVEVSASLREATARS